MSEKRTSERLMIVTQSFPPRNSVAARRWAEMIPTMAQSCKICVFTSEVADTNHHDSYVNTRVIRAGKHHQGAGAGIPRKNKVRLNPVANMRSIDSTVLNFFIKSRRAFKQALVEFQPDTIITTVGPFSTAFFGLYAKWNDRKIKWVLDFRDSMSLFNSSGPGYLTLKQLLDRLIDKSISQRADKLTTVSPSLAQILTRFYGKEVFVIFNGYEEETTDCKSEKSPNAPLDTIELYYAGTIYEHRLAALELLIEFLGKNRKYTLTLRLMNPSFKPLISEIINKFNAHDNVKVKDKVDQKTYMEESAMADVFVIFEQLETTDPIGKGNLTAKLFELLPMTAPILCICREDSDISPLLEETARGKVVSKLEDISDFLDTAANAQRNNDVIKKYSRAQQARNFMEFIKE
ncbi:MAG: glycosyltransferase [Flavobacteriaceae bacterium]|nr:glycosyltransferase [Flavobacteriaceae bacterium]